MTPIDTTDTLTPVGANADGAAILARFPGPVRLSPSRRKWILFLAGSLIPVVIGGVLLRVDVKEGLVMIAVGGLIVLLAGAMLFLPGAGGLLLDAEGFDVVSLGIRQRMRWTEAGNFRSGWQPGRGLARTVVYDSTKIAGFCLTTYLPETYGLRDDDLALLMSQWRDRALAAAPPPRNAGT